MVVGTLRPRRGECGTAVLKGEKLKIVLIGNYAPDAQESMLRYTEMMREGLREAGHEVAVAAPRAILNRAGRPAAGAWKWIGYVDKYLLSLPELMRVARQADIVHVCDHSNSVYVPAIARIPHVVTCHDLLAVRGALGEDTDCPANFTGRLLQRSILRGLRRAQAVACVSAATLVDARRLLNGYRGRLVIAPNALNYPYRRLDADTVRRRLQALPALQEHGWLLHVGSNLRRKNRECVLRAFARVAPNWQGRLVFAGQTLSDGLRAQARKLGIAERIVEVVKPDNEVLEALYCGALALLFPSRFEGFGWPVIEAQACGCPVICSDRDPLPEVAGDAAIFCDADDDAAFGEAVMRLQRHDALRADLVRHGLENAGRYSRAVMIERVVSLYRQVAGGS